MFLHVLQKINLYVLLGVQTFDFEKWWSFSNSPPPQISFKQFSKHLRKCSLIFRTRKGGGKVFEDFCKAM